MTKSLPCINTQQTAEKVISKVQQTLVNLKAISFKRNGFFMFLFLKGNYCSFKTSKPCCLNKCISFIKGKPISEFGSSPSNFLNKQIPKPSLLKLPAQL